MDILPEHIRHEIATAELERDSAQSTDAVRAVINSIPGHAVTPAMLADIAACLGRLARHLSREPRNVAQNHLDDLHDDMRGFA